MRLAMLNSSFVIKCWPLCYLFEGEHLAGRILDDICNNCNVCSLGVSFISAALSQHRAHTSIHGFSHGYKVEGWLEAGLHSKDCGSQFIRLAACRGTISVHSGLTAAITKSNQVLTGGRGLKHPNLRPITYLHVNRQVVQVLHLK